MPELPEVETTRVSLAPIVGQTVQSVQAHCARLRWDIPSDLSLLQGQTLTALTRRAKYLIFSFGTYQVLAHLGMSGSFRLCDASTVLRKHDHISINFSNGVQLRYHDPRRFGAFVWLDALQQQRLAKLAYEPLSDDFNAAYLYALVQRKNTAIKSLIMDQQYVVGVGNIYATEVLFVCNIHPQRRASSLSFKQCEQLVESIKTILRAAIALGGSSLKDYVNAVGENGYFQQSLAVYGQKGKPCPVCTALIQNVVIGQRASCFCPHCQVL